MSQVFKGVNHFPCGSNIPWVNRVNCVNHPIAYLVLNYLFLFRLSRATKKMTTHNGWRTGWCILPLVWLKSVSTSLSDGFLSTSCSNVVSSSGVWLPSRGTDPTSSTANSSNPSSKNTRRNWTSWSIKRKIKQKIWWTQLKVKWRMLREIWWKETIRKMTESGDLKTGDDKKEDWIGRSHKINDKKDDRRIWVKNYPVIRN